MKIRSPIPPKRTRIEIIPLIDIIFFLLASFMMVSLQMHKVRTLKASLPTATLATSTSKSDLVKLVVDRNGQVLMDKKPLSYPELLNVLTNRFQQNPNIPVYIAGTREAKYGSLIYVLDYLKRAGIRQVAVSPRTESIRP
jgi:biopolymer transport protein ExbD